MDYEIVRVALTLINMLVTGIVGIFVWQNKRQQATVSSIVKLESQTKEAIDKLEDHVNQRFKEKCQRLNALESHVNSMPTKRDIIRIHERFDIVVKDTHSMMLMLGDIMGQVKQLTKER
ncbi:MAG: hypothetical protein P1P78_11275 [Methyloprofundus sp.]|nr:hypothetical protein [Methyloprofundus sp.]